MSDSSLVTGNYHNYLIRFVLFICCLLLVCDLKLNLLNPHHHQHSVQTNTDVNSDEFMDGHNLCQLASIRTNRTCELRLGANPRVYDMFLFNDELNMLEIRMQELRDVVDFFVVVESRMTFTGKQKDLHFDKHKERFDFVSEKTIHVVLEELEGSSTWDRERYNRNAMFERGLSVQGKEGRAGDILLTSDIDEIPRSWVVESLKRCHGWEGSTVKLEMRFYYYSYLVRAREDWPVKMLTIIDNDGNYPRPYDLRTGKRDNIIFKDAGWHCSYCFADLAHFRNKISSFSHSEFDLPKYHTKDNIVKSIREGVSLLAHVPRDYFVRVHPEYIDLPRHVAENPARFHFLLNRTGPTAGLSDFQTDG